MQNYNPQMGYPNTGQAPIATQYPYGVNNYSNILTKQPYQNFQQNQFLKCRPVSSKQEAMAFQIDLDGSLWVFTDVGNGKIYTKQVNNDGTATFKTYVFSKDENPYGSTEYVTKEEFNKVIQTLVASIQSTNNQAASQPIPQARPQQEKELIGF